MSSTDSDGIKTPSIHQRIQADDSSNRPAREAVATGVHCYILQLHLCFTIEIVVCALGHGNAAVGHVYAVLLKTLFGGELWRY